MASLFDRQGRSVALGHCLGRGGEGAVHAVAGDPRLAAKVYARGTADAVVRQKLEAMIALSTPALEGVAAWPQDLLLDAPRGRVVGFLMPRLDRHRPIHSLYGPGSRRRAFPAAGWAFLVRAARNLAAAFDTVHAHGHVVGDVNPANVVVSARATVRLLDCDSFQVTLGGSTWPCGVGVPLFTPPELQLGDFAGLVRTADHDDFGLAVIAFHLLMMGRHPFAGCRPGDFLAAEEAIRGGVFAFGASGRARGWTPPPFSPELGDLPGPVARLFERALAGEDASRRGPRPRSAEWVGALEGMEASLVGCERDSRHARVASAACPWCRIEDEGGPSYFATGDAGAELAQAWHAAQAVESPGPAGPPPGAAALARRAAAARRRRLSLPRPWRYLLAGGSAAMALAAVVLRQFRRPGERAARRRSLAAAELELRRLHARWEKECGDAGFQSRRREVEKARRALQSLSELEEHERRHLAARVDRRALAARQRRRREHLARVLRAGVSELSECRDAVLARRQEISRAIEEAERRLFSAGTAPAATGGQQA